MYSNVDKLNLATLTETAARQDVTTAMETFYRQLDREIAEYNPICHNRGLCCDFERWGHRLYVTTLEIAYFLDSLKTFPAINADRCPFAIDGRCTARPRRPMGCRIFYCDPTAAHWQGPLTETYLARLRKLHTDLKVPYLYVDWMAVLRRMTITSAT
ncbi:MAG: hypothetical protein GXY44_11960 [Phycisphaerales bacterium]|nr:hypothetical protein [Phycisphaerales bacterium]